MTYMSFHDDKLWQQAYVVALDVLNETDAMRDHDGVDQVRKHAMMVVTTVAQAVASRDRKFRDMKLHDAANIVVSLRSLLSLLWGQEVLPDDVFNTLDDAYEDLENRLPH